MKYLLVVVLSIIYLNAEEFNLDGVLDAKNRKTQNEKIELKKFEKNSKKTYKKLSDEYYKKYEYTPIEKSKNFSKNSNFCYSIKNEKKRNLCLAWSTKNRSYCYLLGGDDVLRNVCLENCFSTKIKNDTYKNLCLAIKNNNIIYCYGIKEDGFDEDYRNICLGRFQKSYCYSLPDYSDNRYLCLGISLEN